MSRTLDPELGLTLDTTTEHADLGLDLTSSNVNLDLTSDSWHTAFGPELGPLEPVDVSELLAASSPVEVGAAATSTSVSHATLMSLPQTQK